ncbi:MAG: hypothetical protein ISP01_05375 [Methanobrevibacter arboriphilus]|uniref:Uncharacterized protein n=1 Tax=Methanobrevibacter arboriphilus TaxID=39441 RepID=A0A843ANF1_METAZ|nr:hypothetical protein [Methanobrevibacter arboriphilus]MBF4468819.1 hypothetical protein [Methanobrevibacter arboriphilus]
MLNKEEVAEKIFETSKKNIKGFTETTPEGNKITGFISRSRGNQLGSLYITSVNGEETGQYVKGMSKLKYWDNHTPKSSILITLKEDGTNIAMYPLIDHNGEVIEVLCKTRGMPLADKEFQNKANKIINEAQKDRVRNTKCTFCYELYGKENHNEITYNDIDLRMDLIAIYDERGILYRPHNYDDCVMIAFELKKDDLGYHVKTTQQFYKRYEKYLGSYTPEMNRVCKELYEAYNYISEFLEVINHNALKIDHINVVEGVVWNFYDDNRGEYVQVKNKAQSIMEGHKSRNGIPSLFVKKALRKFEDDNGKEESKNIFKENKQSIIDFVVGELSEEWDEHYIHQSKTKHKINLLIDRKFREHPISEDIQEIATNLRSDNPDKPIPELMSKFAFDNPGLKHKSGDVYRALAQMEG